MERDDGPEDEGPFFAWLPPDDRLWRHPSEVPANPSPGAGATAGASGGEDQPGRRHRTPGSVLLGAGAHSPATRIWTVAVLAGIIGAVAASGVGMVSGVFEQQTTVVRSATPVGPAVTLASTAEPIVDWTSVDDAIAPSVVEIDVASASGPVSGSGVLFESGRNEAYVITDSSLVAGGGAIQVTFLSAHQYQGRLIGADPISGLALIAVPWQPSFPQLGSVAGLQDANPVLAVGARTDSGSWVFAGSISAEDREVDVTSGSTMQNLIAVSGPPMPSSAAGGPLMDLQGQVVGITVSVDPTNSSDQGFIFAVPVDVAMHVAQQILAGGYVTHPWLGVTNAIDIPSGIAQSLGLSGGVQVEQVWPGSPASRLGLDSNDIITSYNDQPVTSTGTLTHILSQQSQPDWATIHYLHKGKPVQGTVWVSNQPDGN